MTKSTVFVCLIGLAACSVNDSSSSDLGLTAQAALTPVVRIDCGSASGASPFVADTDFSPTPGTTINHANAIDLTGVTSPAPVAAYQSARIGSFTYTVPGFTGGSSNVVRLHFAETFFTSAGARVFNVAINGAQVLTNFDIFKTAGAINKAVVQQFTLAANASGAYVIQFTSVTNNSLLSALEIDKNDTCVAGQTCTPANVCDKGVISCSTGVPVCVDNGPAPNGNSCGTNQVCNGGACVPCTAGLGCTPANLCHTGVTSCSTGVPVCSDTGLAPNGSSCGANQVCSGGACVACTPNAACTPGGNACRAGQISCANGAPTCVDTGPAPNGTTCGTNRACAGGVCVGCTAGQACTPANMCHTGVVSCASGAPSCVDMGPDSTKNGVTCGSGQVCNAGACVACAAGAACSPANPCDSGATSCSTGTAVCIDKGADIARNGAACGTGQVCNNGVCGSCTAGAACVPANICHVGAISCSSGAPACVDTGADAGKNGASCGTNLVCSGGACTSCVEGLACVPSNACATGVTSCSTGTSVCVDTGASSCRDGSPCGTGRVCNAGVCN
jgi:hypothetical protein